MNLSHVSRYVMASFLFLGACAVPRQPNAAAISSGSATESVLTMTTPIAGSSVNAPVNELMLHFAHPARLLEVRVSGPDGLMPMMVTPAGETVHYALPLPGLMGGNYVVNWRATVGGREHHGNFSFTVRE